MDQTQKIRNEIQKEIDDSLEATRTQDIDEYMKRMPVGALIYDESGEITTREKQREYILRDWAIIDTTLNINCQIDSLQVFADSAIVYTSQRWERMMFHRDGINKDTVITTQIHKELWKKGINRWENYQIEELGGQIFINGKRYFE